MQQNKTVEFATGLFIVLGLMAMFFLLTQTTNIETYRDNAGYMVTARFSNVGSLKVRAPVTMAGVTIGRVESIEFDDTQLDAIVTLKINARYDKLPADTSASILTSGLLGEKYVGLEPGADVEYLASNDEILFTQSAIVLENLVSKYLFDQASGESK